MSAKKSSPESREIVSTTNKAADTKDVVQNRRRFIHQEKLRLCLHNALHSE